MIHRRQGAEQTGELQARLKKLCKRARKEGKEWLKGELKKEVRTLKRMVANEGRDGLQRALRGVKWEQLRPLMLQAGMGSEHVVTTLSLAELQSRLNSLYYSFHRGNVSCGCVHDMFLYSLTLCPHSAVVKNGI